LTFLPMDEVRRLGALEGSEINKAKEVLAFEFTKLVHGEEEAQKAHEAAKSLFAGGMDSSNIPSTTVTEVGLAEGMDLLQVLCDINFVKSRGEGKRLVKQGGIYVNENQVKDFAQQLTLTDLEDGKITIRKGKKSFHQLKL